MTILSSYKSDSFGSRYKAAGANAVNASGELDTVEFMNIAHDDVVAWPRRARRDYPEVVNNHMESTVIPFVKHSFEVNNLILDIFNDKLGLPSGKLRECHKSSEFSGSEARIIKNRITSNTSKEAIGAHTDFGSLVSVAIFLNYLILKACLSRFSTTA